MLSNNTNQKKQKQQKKQQKKEPVRQPKESSTNCNEAEVAEPISEEEQLSIDNLCRLLYDLYREQQFSKHNPKHF